MVVTGTEVERGPAARRSSTRRSSVFAEHGLHGASTEEIARGAGISQPYVFRLFGTKKELYLAVVARCFRQTLELMQRAAEGKRGEEALNAIGQAYGELLESDRVVPARADAGLRRERGPGGRGGRPQRLRRPRRLRRARLGARARTRSRASSPTEC